MSFDGIEWFLMVTLIYLPNYYLDTMSQNDSPVRMVFDLQRSTIEGTQDLIQNGVDIQRDLNARFVEGIDPARDATDRSTDLVRTGFETYFDAIEAVVPGDQDVLADVRETVDEQLDTLEESQHEALDQLEENLRDGADSVDEFLGDFLEQLESQVESVLEAHEDLEAQTVEALEDLEGQIQDLQDELEARGDEFQERLEEQFDGIQEQLEEGADSFQRRVEDVTERVQDAAEAPDADDTDVDASA